MLIPATRYRDPEAALSFLTSVLGLKELAVYRDDSGVIVHAELALGTGVFMFGAAQAETPFGAYMADPSETGGRATMSVYAVVDDPAACHARAVEAGAEILLPLEDQPQGGASFTLRDPGGHVWTLGDYAPPVSA